MSINSKITSSCKNQFGANVSKRGQLITAPLDFTKMYPQKLDVINTAYSYIGPLAGKRFVITVITLMANKNVGASDATIEIYEADSLTSITVMESIFKTELVKYGHIEMTGLNLITNEGVWINGKTDDDDIFTNIGGYYVEA